MSLIALMENKCVGVVLIFENDLQPRSELTPWLAGLYVDAEYYKRRGWTLLEETIDEYGQDTSVFYMEL
ncbi:MAG: hypothetical protein H7Y18_13345 [Clostridiaceae bacterium]|nr:hypothetical protein [Clostridiaceae bacterium]